MLSDAPFPCEKCGACCRHIGLVMELHEFIKPDGSCVHLTADNLCDIYYLRPGICNMEKQYELWKHEYSWENFVELNKIVCVKLRRIREGKNEEISAVELLPNAEGGTPPTVSGLQPEP